MVSAPNDVAAFVAGLGVSVPESAVVSAVWVSAVTAVEGVVVVWGRWQGGYKRAVGQRCLVATLRTNEKVDLQLSNC